MGIANFEEYQNEKGGGTLWDLLGYWDWFEQDYF